MRGDPAAAGDETAEELLERVRGMVPPALAAAGAAAGFPGRWKAIAAKLEALPACLSDLSSHPCFAKNALCRELLQSVAATLAEAADLAGRCRGPPPDGKLRTQSAIDALSGKLDLNIRDCALLVRTGVLSDASGPSPPAEAPAHADVQELLARLQIGHTEAKNRAMDGLLEALRNDEKSVLSVLGRANVSAMVQLLTALVPVACGRGVRHLQRPCSCRRASCRRSSGWPSPAASSGARRPRSRCSAYPPRPLTLRARSSATAALARSSL